MNIDLQIACLRKELARRERMYPKFVSEGHMPQERATHEVTAMSAALQTLAQLRGIVQCGRAPTETAQEAA